MFKTINYIMIPQGQAQHLKIHHGAITEYSRLENTSWHYRVTLNTWKYGITMARSTLENEPKDYNSTLIIRKYIMALTLLAQH